MKDRIKIIIKLLKGEGRNKKIVFRGLKKTPTNHTLTDHLPSFQQTVGINES